MMARTLVKVSSSSYEAFGAVPTRSAPRPPEKRTARRMARGTASASISVHATLAMRCTIRARTGGGKSASGGGPGSRRGHVGRRAQQRFQRLDLLRRIPVSRPDDPFHHPALAIDDEGLGIAPYLVA